MYHKVLIIGGGAAGVTAAISAKDKGLDVAIIERNDRIGKKILTTGNGRCNITNKYINLSNYHCSNNNFVKPTLNNFSVEDTINFFNTLGIPLITLNDGKMYPMSLQASSVLDILRLALDERNIPIYFNSKVAHINKSENLFQVITSDGSKYESNSLILACGGKSAPNTGSDGSGFNIAKDLGHSIVTPVPSLVQLKLKYPRLKALSGIKFDGSAEIYINNKPLRKELGEILFTDYGISGPPILQLSGIASKSLHKKNTVTLKVDMMPNINYEDLKNLLENRWGTFGYRSVFNSLIGVINKKLIPIILKEANILDIHSPCWNLNWDEKESIYKLLKSWTFEVYDTNSFKNSQVTSGGVNTSEIDSLTLQSTIIPNLYFAGEILDVDGDCGGFNLQWAWSSGYLAGQQQK